MAAENEGLGRPSTETSVSFACSRRRSELPSVKLVPSQGERLREAREQRVRFRPEDNQESEGSDLHRETLVSLRFHETTRNSIPTIAESSSKDSKQKIAKSVKAPLEPRSFTENEGLDRPSTETSVSFACSRRRSELPSVRLVPSQGETLRWSIRRPV